MIPSLDFFAQRKEEAMETILYTKGENFIVKSVYFSEEQVFGTVFEYPDGSILVAESYKSIMNIMETHDFWCKFSGVISTPLTPSQIEKHLTRYSLRAC